MHITISEHISCTHAFQFYLSVVGPHSPEASINLLLVLIPHEPMTHVQSKYEQLKQSVQILPNCGFLPHSDPLAKVTK